MHNAVLFTLQKVNSSFCICTVVFRTTEISKQILPRLLSLCRMKDNMEFKLAINLIP